MAHDLGEFSTDGKDSHLHPKRHSLAAMAHDDPSPLSTTPITAPSRSTPPQTALATERPTTLENYMTSSSSNTNSPGMSSNRHFGGLDHDIAKFAQSPLARAANHDLSGRGSLVNGNLEDLTQRLSAYTLNRDNPSSAPVTPPTSQFYDSRSRASTLTESSPPLQTMQKDTRIPHHYLTPPSEGQSSPANLVVSQSLPVSRRNSNTEAMRVGQDLSVIYENTPGPIIYPSEHRKSSGTSGTWSTSSPEATFAQSTHGYDDSVEPRGDSISSKHVFGMLKTEDGQFPFLSNLAESTSSSQMPLSRGARHGSTPSWPSGSSLPTRNHASRSSYPEQSEARTSSSVDLEYRAVTERSSGNPSPHATMLRTPPNGHSPGRFDLNSNEFVPQTWTGMNGDHIIPRDNTQRPLGAYYAEHGNSTYAASSYVPPTEYTAHGSYYGPARTQQPYDPNYIARQMESQQDNSYEYRTQSFYNREYSSFTPRNTRTHKRYGSNDYERLILSKSRIQDFASKIPDLCRDQNGCRHLQGELQTRDEETIEVIYNGAKPYFPDLMSDPFGNYLCQKLLEVCNDSQRTELVKIVAPNIVQISLNQHGTRAVQKLLDHLTIPEQVELVKDALRPDVVLLAKDLNGNHVIQKCLNKLDSGDKQFIFDAISQNCIEVATHKHGCCVFQRCIDHANDQQGDQLYNELIKNTVQLSQDQFGNYVLQYILDRPETNLAPLIHQFKNHVVQLSKAKFSSNVIEKCVRVAKPQDREYLISEMVRPKAMAEMIDDNFANYVVQTALDYAEGDQRAQLTKEILPLLNSIRSRSWSKRIMSKLGVGMTNNGHHESSRHMPPRQYIDDRVHQRMTSNPGLPIHGYVQNERVVDHPPPGFMHTNPVGTHSDRNVYRTQSAQSHTPQQYGNFYPYGPRAPVHQSEYRTNGEY